MYWDNRKKVIADANSILNLCDSLKIDTIAGPTTSGAVIASICFALSDKINVLFLGKKGYRRNKHGDGIQGFFGKEHGPFGRILIVDDASETGDSIFDAINEIKCHQLSGTKIIGCVTSFYTDKASKAIFGVYPDIRLFSICCNSSIVEITVYS